MLSFVDKTLGWIEYYELRGQRYVTTDDLEAEMRLPAAAIGAALAELVRRHELVRVLPPAGPARYRRRCSGGSEATCL
jgi:hypothetical protein